MTFNIFGKRTWVLAVTRSKLIAARVNLRNGQIDKSIIERYSSGDLQQKIKLIKESIGINKFKLLLSDDISTFLGIKIPLNLGTEQKREYILSRLEDFINFEPEDPYWGYTFAGRIDNKARIVVYTTDKKLYVNLTSAIKANDLVIEEIQPESIALTRNENPLIGAALGPQIIDEEAVYLDIEIEEVPKDAPNKLKDKLFGKRISILFKLSMTVILAVLTVGSAYYYFQYRGSRSGHEEASADGDTEITAEPTASSEILDEIQPNSTPGLVVQPGYSISILNGSGVSGEAGYVQNKLQNEGLNDIETGNAERLDYESTEIHLKESVTDSIRRNLESILSEEYEVDIIDEPLPENSEFDIRIIVGQKSS